MTWDEWNTHKVQNDGISSATQRKYAGEIRDFIKYISTRSVFTREVKKHFGIELTQFLDQDAVLHHLFEREQREPRATFTPELLDQFFDALKSRIREQASHAHRELLNLQRDLALFYLAAATGLRVGSLIALNTHSFRPNPKVPEMGEYGAYTTVGKGSRGSGPKVIENLIDDPKAPPLLNWYINEVRPYYLKPNNPDEPALFLSERGRRISYQAIYVRFQKRLADADLLGMNLDIHSFRRGKATTCGTRYNIETTRRMLNHKFSATTQGYMAIPDEYCQDQIADHIREQGRRSVEKELKNTHPLEQPEGEHDD